MAITRILTFKALHILITGRVQGVGFRPFVSRIANQYKLSGWVLNRSGEVEIRVEGLPQNLEAFQRALVEQAPPLAKPNPPVCTAVPWEGLCGFVIKHSEAGQGGNLHIPPDYFVCDDCLAEMQDPTERRYRYPFINCTQCGPRYTLIDRLPYDRPNTAMGSFQLCPACRAEYENPLDRRYHAQPLACAECGPKLRFRQPCRPEINNTVELSRHTGRDCRYPEHREVNGDCPPWPLGSGNPCRNDVQEPVSTALGLGGISGSLIQRQAFKIPLNPPFAKGEAAKAPLNPPFAKGEAVKVPLNLPFVKGEAVNSPALLDITGNQAALDACLDALGKGLIVAVKGVGGYHLLCDATDNAAVDRLRCLKHRPDKPLAVLLPRRGTDGLDYVRTVADPETSELELLSSPLRPIVLMRKRRDATPLAEAIAPGLNEVGLMLAYSPLHHLLIDAFDAPLVATSANISGEPVLTDSVEVERRLGQVADAFLHHDRPIRRPADDSVFMRIAGKLRPLRLGRGLAPVEIALPFELQKPLLAVGSDLKNTVALGFGNRIVVSSHIGDLGTVRSGEVFERVIADLQSLYQINPAAIVCDAHPDYRSSRWARSRQIPIIRVFHHHAHASALAGEYGLMAQEMLVFTWDGVGLGEDRTLWGGEALSGCPGSWRRVGSMRPFRLLGGDKASREPWRCGLALCLEMGMAWESWPKNTELLVHAWERQLNCPVSSSVGRLFDAAAALTGLSMDASFEGKAAMRLEALSEPIDGFIELPLQRDGAGLWRGDWGPLLPMLLDNTLSVIERGSLFHASIAGLIVAQAVKIREGQGLNKVGLTGGVFQNRLLTEQAASLLEQQGFEVYLPTEIPANDAGISYGQIIEAAAQLLV